LGKAVKQGMPLREGKPGGIPADNMTVTDWFWTLPRDVVSFLLTCQAPRCAQRRFSYGKNRSILTRDKVFYHG
jgi:hypothetical protein